MLPPNLCLLRRMELNLIRQDPTVQIGAAIRPCKIGCNLACLGPYRA